MRYLLMGLGFTMISLTDAPKEVYTIDTTFQFSIFDIITTWSNRDSVNLSHYINDSVGVGMLYRLGASPRYETIYSIGFENNSYPYLFFGMPLEITTTYFDNEPIFDCDNGQFENGVLGIFVNESNRGNGSFLLSQVQLALGDYSDWSIQEFQKVTTIEQESKRIVAIDSKGNSFIFYINYINQKWCLTFIDMLTTDCSA